MKTYQNYIDAREKFYQCIIRILIKLFTVVLNFPNFFIIMNIQGSSSGIVFKGRVSMIQPNYCFDMFVYTSIEKTDSTSSLNSYYSRHTFVKPLLALIRFVSLKMVYSVDMYSTSLCAVKI